MVGVVLAGVASGVDAVLHARSDYFLDICPQDGLEHLALGQHQVAIGARSDVGSHDGAQFHRLTVFTTG